MLGNLTDRVLSERTIGVPRRMALGALFVLVTFFCVLLRGLTLLGANPTWILGSTVFVTCLAAGQALLFEGRRPRDVSILVGFFTLPWIVCCAVCFETMGTGTWSSFVSTAFSCAAMAMCLGPLVGYLVGILLAGGFFLFEHWWLGTNTIGQWIGPSEPEPLDGQVLRWLQKQPARFRGYPGRMSLVVIAWSLLFACVVSPAFSEQTLRFHLHALAALLALAIFLSGVLHLRWRSLWLLVASCLTVIPVSASLSRVVYISDCASQETIQVAVTLAALAVGLVVMAILGWIQVALCRGMRWDVKLDHPGILFGYGLICILASWCANSYVARINASPSERALASVRKLGGNVSYRFQGLSWQSFPPPLESIYLTGGNGDTVLAMLAKDVDLSALRYLTINSTLSDQGLRNLQRLRLQYLNLSTTRISPRTFANLDLDVDTLDVSRTAISDQTIMDLHAAEYLRTRLRWLNVERTRVSDDGLARLLQFECLQSVNLASCAITGQGFAQAPPTTALRYLSMKDTLLDDEGLLAAVSVCPSLWHLDLRGTQVTDQGLAALKKLTSLSRLEVDPQQFSSSSLEALLNRFPSLEIDDAE